MAKISLKEKYLIYKVRQNKDPEAYGELYDFYVEKIYRFIYFKVKTKEEAEDLTSEVFLKTWEYIKGTNKKIENLNALFYRVARNRVIDHYRSRRQDEVLTDQEQMARIEEKRDLMKQAEAKVELERAEEYLAQLKDIYKEVVILRHVEGFSIKEIAEITQKTPGNVRVVLHRAVSALKELNDEK